MVNFELLQMHFIDMICMSFNSVQEEVIKNVKDFAMKLGLIQDPENEEE